jgi:hypothetical protein
MNWNVQENLQAWQHFVLAVEWELQRLVELV